MFDNGEASYPNARARCPRIKRTLCLGRYGDKKLWKLIWLWNLRKFYKFHYSWRRLEFVWMWWKNCIWFIVGFVWFIKTLQYLILYDHLYYNIIFCCDSSSMMYLNMKKVWFVIIFWNKIEIYILCNMKRSLRKYNTRCRYWRFFNITDQSFRLVIGYILKNLDFFWFTVKKMRVGVSYNVLRYIGWRFIILNRALISHLVAGMPTSPRPIYCFLTTKKALRQ